MIPNWLTFVSSFAVAAAIGFGAFCLMRNWGQDRVVCARCRYPADGLCGTRCPECGLDSRDKSRVPSIRRACALTAWLLFCWTLFAALGLTRSWSWIFKTVPGAVESAHINAFTHSFHGEPYNEVVLEFHKSWKKGWGTAKQLAAVKWIVSFRSEGKTILQIFGDSLENTACFRDGNAETHCVRELDASKLADWLTRRFPSAHDRLVESDSKHVLMLIDYWMTQPSTSDASERSNANDEWDLFSRSFSNLPRPVPIGTMPATHWLAIAIFVAICLWLSGMWFIFMQARAWMLKPSVDKTPDQHQVGEHPDI